MVGISNFLLSEELGILWQMTYSAKEDRWDYYSITFKQIRETLLPSYPISVLCHEDQTPQCMEMATYMLKQSYCTSMSIIDSIVTYDDYLRWDPYCERYHWCRSLCILLQLLTPSCLGHTLYTCCCNFLNVIKPRVRMFKEENATSLPLAERQ